MRKMSITSQAKVPSQKDYDLNGTGWGPDYQDPATYLNILDAKKGSALKHLGITKVKIQKLWLKLDLMSTRNSWMECSIRNKRS